MRGLQPLVSKGLPKPPCPPACHQCSSAHQAHPGLRPCCGTARVLMPRLLWLWFAVWDRLEAENPGFFAAFRAKLDVTVSLLWPPACCCALVLLGAAIGHSA